MAKVARTYKLWLLVDRERQEVVDILPTRQQARVWGGGELKVVGLPLTKTQVQTITRAIR